MLKSQIKTGQTPKEMTNLIVGNHIVEARYNYTLIQERIFNHIIWYCQEYLAAVRRGDTVIQLGLFTDTSTMNMIKVPIRLNHIGKPDEYNYIRKSCINMREVTVKTKVKDRQGIHWHVWEGVINSIEEPQDKGRSNMIYAVVSKSVAEMLVQLDRRSDGTPIRFTMFKYEICMSAKNKYTARMYKILCRWRDQRNIYISVEDLRAALDLKDKYKQGEALKRRILSPVHQELYQYADIWWDLTSTEFEVKDGKKIMGFNFTIKTVGDSLHYVKQKEAIVFAFKIDFGFKPAHIKKVQHIIDNQTLWKSMDWRINVIKEEMRKGNTRDVPAYVVTSLLNHFKDAS